MRRNETRSLGLIAQLRVKSGTAPNCSTKVYWGHPPRGHRLRQATGDNLDAGMPFEVRGVSFRIRGAEGLGLAGSPGGFLPLADLRRDVAILISSGQDWTNRTTRIAARAPGLDIVSQVLVIRDAAGWRISETGRELLASIENAAASNNSQEPASDVVKAPLATAASSRPRRSE
jgi:hypothetical protein